MLLPTLLRVVAPTFRSNRPRLDAQVLGKRRKVVADMCEQLAARARREAQGAAWAVLRHSTEGGGQGVPAAVERFLKQRLMVVAERDVEG